MANIRQNLFFALPYNGLGIPIAADVLYPHTAWQLSPMIAAVAMAASSLSVVGNANRLRRFQPPFTAPPPTTVAQPANRSCTPAGACDGMGAKDLRGGDLSQYPAGVCEARLVVEDPTTEVTEMTALIGVALLLLLGFYVYRTVRLAPGDASTRNPVLARLARVLDIDVPNTRAEAREGELTRQLLAGSIDAATYQQQLSQLAQESYARTGDAR